ncbi:hypothetical protein EJB05_31841 [Eragrostis curvula]|uniref:RING-type E3 ubiquitin transferase n=1 Tax=Eragrostis curvula TaxID=38414 RepID=A0A5J9UEI8_9POAL|nr:hypothetical protein EJB05_31841 [Eragrostis curvula]
MLHLSERGSPQTAEQEGYKNKTPPPPSEKPSQERRVRIGEATAGGGLQDGKGGGGGGGGELVAAGRRVDGEISFKMDSRVLDCSICFEPLKPPIYQCEVGHAVCFRCRGKLCNTCPSCSRAIGHCRCFALEQMVNAIKMPCSNANYGCDKIIAYYQKETHENACMYAPCFCPEDGCSFIGSTGSLLNHFVTEHKWSQTNFHYNKALKISVKRHSRFTLLVGEDMSMFLLLNIFAHIGNALSLLCIRPNESGSSVSSKMSAVQRAEGDKGRYVFQMDPHVASSSLNGGVQLGRFFLLVPPDLVDESTDELTVNIRIDTIESASSDH